MRGAWTQVIIDPKWLTNKTSGLRWRGLDFVLKRRATSKTNHSLEEAKLNKFTTRTSFPMEIGKWIRHILTNHVNKMADRTTCWAMKLPKAATCHVLNTTKATRKTTRPMIVYQSQVKVSPELNGCPNRPDKELWRPPCLFDFVVNAGMPKSKLFHKKNLRNRH